jgi:cell division protein FtsW
VSRPIQEHDPVAKYLLLGAACFLTAGGLLMIYSASSVADVQKYTDAAYHLKRQLLNAGLGVVLMLLIARIDYRKLRPLVFPVLVIADVLLLVVAFMGRSTLGAQRWLMLGPVPIQPSEIAKFAVVAAVALVLASTPPHRRTLGGILLPLAAIVFPTAALVMMQPDMGTTMAMIVSVLFLLWIGDLGLKSWGVLVAAVLSAIPVAIVLAPYRMARLMSFLNPWQRGKDGAFVGHQAVQSMYAFGSGGWHGLGLGMSRQKFFYLPAAHTDFIFAIIGEELGLIGALSVVIGFAILTYAGLRIASRTHDRFGRLLAGGVMVAIASQATLNMFAVTGMMPITGIPLPFVSYGGTAMVLNLASLGLVLSVYRYGRIAARRARPVPVLSEENVIEGPAEWRRYGGSHLSSIDGGRRAAR